MQVVKLLSEYIQIILGNINKAGEQFLERLVHLKSNFK